MREILFRGKTYDGEWVEGFLFNSQLCRIFWATAFNEEEDNMFYCEGKDVIPETVGQFTGLTDKNGNKIFEGDIVQGTIVSAWNKALIRCEVVYNKDGFISVERTRNQGVHKVKFAKDIEVIGNIHDNPELLGE